MSEEKKPKGKVDYERDKQINDFIGIKVRKSTGMLEALSAMTEVTGVSKNAYIIAAVCEKLRRDGYLSQEQEKN